MSPDVCFLFTLTNGEEILRVALKIDANKLKGDCFENPMEPENRKQLKELLPLHVKNYGDIVLVEEIFEITEIK